LTIYISQESVTTQLRCSGIFDNKVTANFPQNVSRERILKTSQNLAKT